MKKMKSQQKYVSFIPNSNQFGAQEDIGKPLISGRNTMSEATQMFKSSTN